MAVNYQAWNAIPQGGMSFLKAYEAAKKTAQDTPQWDPAELGIKDAPAGFKLDRGTVDKILTARAKSTANGGFGGRGAAGLINGLLTGPEKSKIDTLETSIPIHNSITDAMVALQKGDLSYGQALANSYLSQHPDASALFHDYKLNPASTGSIYNALTRMGAIEQFKLQLGTSAMPTEEAIRHNQSLYPSMTEISQHSPAVAQKMNIITDSLIHGALAGPRNRLSLYRDPKSGVFFSPYHESMYGNLEEKEKELRSVLRFLPDTQVDPAGQMQVPGLTGVAPNADQATQQRAAKQKRLEELRMKASQPGNLTVTPQVP